MTGPAIATVHASCVAFGDIGILLRGPSGAGKSDLAYRLIEAGAVLVADDRVAFSVREGRLIADAPAQLAGKLELRGVGLVELPAVVKIPVELVADLVAPADVERAPQLSWEVLDGVRIRRISVAPFEQSAVAKIRVAAYDALSKPDPVTGARCRDEDRTGIRQ